MSGKTTNLEIVHQKAPEEHKGDLTSISTDGDRTLFFDFMPLDLGKIAGMQTKFQLYTVPGQVYYNSTRKLVLQGVDGVIFVADSDPTKMDENIESYQNLIDNLEEYGKDVRELPHVIQYNKRDLPNALSVEDADKQLNRFGVPTFEAVANSGEGVFPTLKTLAGMVLESINKQEKPSSRPARPRSQPVAPPPQEAPQQVEAPAAKQQASRAGRPGKVAAQGARQPQQAGRPQGRRPQQQVQRSRGQAAGQQPAPVAAKSEGKGFLVAFLVLLIAAVAGVAFLVLDQGV
jgi:signal recognition particle receptor subunit beta